MWLIWASGFYTHWKLWKQWQHNDSLWTNPGNKENAAKTQLTRWTAMQVSKQRWRFPKKQWTNHAQGNTAGPEDLEFLTFLAVEIARLPMGPKRLFAAWSLQLKNTAFARQYCFWFVSDHKPFWPLRKCLLPSEIVRFAWESLHIHINGGRVPGSWGRDPACELPKLMKTIRKPRKPLDVHGS